MKTIIETFDLTKIYKLKGHHQEILALDKANLSINEGETFGLLGPNGAGKTTMIQILVTLLQPTSGYALIDGFNIRKQQIEIKKRIGLMLGSTMIYRRITGYNNLKFFCKIYDIKNYNERIHEIAKEFGLERWLNQYVERYSSGMRTKLALCRALLIEPPILFLDEPTFGLDISSKLFVVDKLKKLNLTIFLTSHDMNVAEKLCDRIAFIKEGKILKVGTQKELKTLIKSEINISVDIYQGKKELKSELNQQSFINDASDSNSGLIIKLNDKNYYKDLFSILRKYNVQKIREHDLSLEDLFVKII
ncbi:MAG: ABC transporter ATP-binding protein [Promethearchaeota archaeon]